MISGLVPSPVTSLSVSNVSTTDIAVNWTIPSSEDGNYRGVGRNFRKGGGAIITAREARREFFFFGATPFWGVVTPFSAVLTN